MRKKKWIFVAAPLALVAFVIIGGEVVMHLWNWLLPPLFGWRLITFWQAFGLLVLCRILFGSHGGPRSHIRRRMEEKWTGRWEQMTPEEREKFRQGWRSRCGSFSPPAGESKGTA